MYPIRYMMMAFVLLSITACHSQINNKKTENVTIQGNCGMCKKAIERAGNKKGEATVDWNIDAKQATLSYDSTKTSGDEILKRIALAGYDNALFMAPDDTYGKLPACCQYERSKKEVHKTGMNHHAGTDDKQSQKDHSAHAKHENDEVEKPSANPLSGVFDRYFALKDALVKSDGAQASNQAKALKAEVASVKMENLKEEVHIQWMNILIPLKRDASQLSETQNIVHQRELFRSLSEHLYRVMKLSAHETPTYYQFCPMANDGKGANWLSKGKEIKNPYYGSQMLGCGKTVETLK